MIVGQASISESLYSGFQTQFWVISFTSWLVEFGHSDSDDCKMGKTEGEKKGMEKREITERLELWRKMSWSRVSE